MADPRLMRKRFLLVKTETTPGADSAPDATNGIYAENLTVKKLTAKTVDRNTIKPFLGASAKVTASFYGQVDVDVALAIGGSSDGSPSPGATPGYDALMTGCGLARTTSASAITGTAQGGTTGTIQLAAGASATDDAYAGLTIQAAVVTNTAQAPGSTAKNLIKLAVGSSAVDGYYNNLKIRVNHFNGTIVSAGQTVSSVNKVYLDAAVGANDLVNTYIAVTTGSVTERRRITAYNAANKRAALNKPLGTAPTNTSTYVIYQDRVISAYVGATVLATLDRALKFITTATTTYEITTAPHLITSYNGASKIASVAQPFEQAPTNATTYTINPYVKYLPISDNVPSNTLYFYEDGALHSFIYARGNLSIEFNREQIPILKFSYTGIVDRYEDAAFPAFSIGAWVEPLPVNFENTQDLIVHGYRDTVMDKLTVDLGNQVEYYNAPGAELVYIKDRSVKGNLTLWSPLQSAVDFYAIVKNNDANVVAFTHGPVGNQVAILAKSTQLLNPTDGGNNDMVQIGLELNMLPTGTGNNEIAIILQ